MWRWPFLASLIPPEFRLSLGEGNTPLLRSRQIGASLGLEHLLLKCEGQNPSGSYKDRFAAVAVSNMLREGMRRCIATSSGNTGAALAAYCAAAGIDCQIAIVETAPDQKLKQMGAYGARLFKVRGFGVDPQITARVFQTIQSRARQLGAALQISAYAYSEVGMRGVETISYEIAEQAAEGIDHVFVPAGGGGLTLAIARGFASQNRRGPRVHCVQPRGNDTIATPLRQGAARARSVECATLISGLQVANVIDGDQAIAACRASGGTGYIVTDEAVWEMQRRLAQDEGIFCEPAGAVALAGAVEALNRGEISRHDRICCLVSGNGFKDIASLDRILEKSLCPTVDLSELEANPCSI